MVYCQILNQITYVRLVSGLVLNLIISVLWFASSY